MVLPDATILLDYMQHLAARSSREMTVHAERMRENLELTHGALYSQRALTALVESGMQRDDAYRIVQEPAQRAWDDGHQLPRPAGRAARHATPGESRRERDAASIGMRCSTPGAYLAHLPELFERLEALRGSDS